MPTSPLTPGGQMGALPGIRTRLWLSQTAARLCPGTRSRAAHLLFLRNLGCQIGDGLLTYDGLQHGFAEGNPLVAAPTERWGAVWRLLFWKAEAGGLLVLLWRCAEYPSAVCGLALTAGSYLVFSFMPWMGLLLTHSLV